MFILYKKIFEEELERQFTHVGTRVIDTRKCPDIPGSARVYPGGVPRTRAHSTLEVGTLRILSIMGIGITRMIRHVIWIWRK